MDAKQAELSVREWLPSILIITVIPFTPLLVSWQWSWLEGWLYAITTILGFAVSRLQFMTFVAFLPVFKH